MIDWMQANEVVLWWLAASSGLAFLATLIIVPVLVARIPPDYFHAQRRQRSSVVQHPALRVLWLIVKNALGLVLIVMGLLMLVLPGQGLITLLFGIMLLNFPGKYRLERWIVSRRPVLRTINWLRRRAKRAPLRL